MKVIELYKELFSTFFRKMNGIDYEVGKTALMEALDKLSEVEGSESYAFSRVINGRKCVMVFTKEYKFTSYLKHYLKVSGVELVEEKEDA